MLSISEEYTRMDNLVNTQMNCDLHLNYSPAYIQSMSIGDRLDKAMKSAGYKSQTALAKASGVPQPTVNRILKGGGKRGPETETIKRLAGACGVSFTWLMDDDNDAQIEKVEIRLTETTTSHSDASKYTLMFVTQDEIDILTAYRLAPEMNQKMIYLTATKLPRDSRKLKSIPKPKAK